MKETERDKKWKQNEERKKQRMYVKKKRRSKETNHLIVFNMHPGL
jgi:hypothetical protein